MIATDRFFDPEPTQKNKALELYALIKDLPIISPHNHVNPALFSSPDSRFGNPVEVLIRPDHYLLRMLYSQGIAYQDLLSKENPHQVWQIFADHFYLFRGTPSAAWMTHTLESIFGISEKLNSESAMRIYQSIESALSAPAFTPRQLFHKMNIETLATTDSATDSLEHHQAIQTSGWKARIRPTFRPDQIIEIQTSAWRQNIKKLGSLSKIDIQNFHSFILATEERRQYFKSLGATATDIGVTHPLTLHLPHKEVENIFQRGLKGETSSDDADQFRAHMLWESARMSVEDGLVLQIHAGSQRNHNPQIYDRLGPDMGFDIPVKTEFTLNLKPLLDSFGNSPNLTLILFTLDESAYSRELAPLAGAYPAIKLGPPWWFHDSWNGMKRYFDRVIETAGIYNTVGFNDDTRSFLAIPARHDVWRRASANWLAGLLVRHVIDQKDAEQMAVELAVGLAKKAYRLE